MESSTHKLLTLKISNNLNKNGVIDRENIERHKKKTPPTHGVSRQSLITWKMRSREGRRRPTAFLLLTTNHDKEKKKKRDKIEGRLTQEDTRLISLSRSLETSSFKQHKRRPKGGST